MVVFSKRRKSSATLPSTTTISNQKLSKAPASASASEPKRWSDVATGRKSTHPSLSRSQDVFGTFELCEQILEYLPMKDVLRATQVCRDIKQVVANSPPLQVKLFFKPDPTLGKLAVSDSDKLLSGTKADEHIAAAKASGEERTGEIALFTLHPILKMEYRPQRFKHMGMVQNAINHVRTGHRNEVNRGLAFLFIQDTKVFMGELDASKLGKMFVSQPPVKEVGLGIGVYHPWVALPKRTLVHNQTGVTIGQVLSAVRDAGKEHFYYDGLQVKVDLYFREGFIVEPDARRAAEEAGELSKEDDPTRWEPDPSMSDLWHLREGGFQF